MSWIADYDTHGREFPTCVHVTKTTGGMTHGATYVPIQDGKDVRAENAKLRELVHGLNHCTTWANEDGKDCLSCPLWHEKNCTAEDIERELGIGVVK